MAAAFVSLFEGAAAMFIEGGRFPRIFRRSKAILLIRLEKGRP